MQVLLDAISSDRCPNYPKIIENDTAFHDVISGQPESPGMNIISNLREQITPSGDGPCPIPGRLVDMIAEHQNIIDALAERNGESPESGADPHGKCRTDLLKVIETKEQSAKDKKEGESIMAKNQTLGTHCSPDEAETERPPFPIIPIFFFPVKIHGG